MSFLDYLLGRKQPSAQVAKERLQIILAHERAGRMGPAPDYLPQLKEELIAVISKYISVNQDDIKVSLEKQDNYEVLELNILLPDAAKR
ncbi:cell division topological specificity factor MinE [Chitinivorax sp. PXF-14]|uniref:cell division topological specificity factor MinE n=1 Tax=Chitinivorax sp. PXF-14 TaxID=3230488 RepID=UPI003467A5C5